MKKVLIVDDASFVRLAIRTVLEKNGFEVVGEACDGKEGYEKYKELKPDAVTMDITMPNVDGLEALKAIMEYDSKARVVMITAMGQERKVKDAIMLGARSFIVKPYKEEQVVKTINQALL